MMRTWLPALFYTALLLLPHPGAAQALPADFKFSITVGGTAPWKAKTTITIDSAGAGHYVRYTTGGDPTTLADTTFTVSMSDVQALWKTIQDSSFFTLASQTDSTVGGGEFAKVTITGSGVTHQVIVRNIAQPKLQAIISSLNASLPVTLQVSYSPPGSYNITPVDPCGSPVDTTLGTRVNNNQFRSLHHADPKITYWFERRISAVAASSSSISRTALLPSSSIDAAAIVPHAGTVVAYNMSIQDAVRKHIAKLSSKGEFYGDGVSITVDNTHTPPSNTVNITLYLEFYGPLATQAAISKIEQDISKKWDGLKTSSGKTIDLQFATLWDPLRNSPPSTPGYHEIKLVPADAVRSYVGGNPKPNAGVGNCVWELNQDPGTYAHEAGHLMGLPDRYVDYDKKADGRWVNADNGQAYANDDAFAAYLVTKYPNLTLTRAKNALKNDDTYSVPLDGSENDLMADVAKPARQSDIDQIASNPGVLVTVPTGTVFVNRNRNNQNVVATHQDDLFVKKGDRRTQNGIYVACIDHYRGVPTTNAVFDVAPALGTWNGVKAARSMASLTQYLDSAGFYCGTNFTAQEAVWRISDNSLGTSDVDDLLHAAGVTLGSQEISDFPHMTPPSSNDTSSNPFIPNELFVAHITPQFSAGTPGSAVHVSASVSAPTDAALKPTYTWSAMAPDSTPASITAMDTTATFTPAKSGIYELGLHFSFTDSLFGQRSFTSAGKSYVIVPDANTETFEHTNLADKFPWTSMGDVPWTISNSSAQTGSFSAQAGSISLSQQSTLAVTVVLPTDGVLSFSARTALPPNGELVFFIDTLWTDAFDGLSDWRVVREPITAGRHRLSWTYWTLLPEDTVMPGNAWVDNIFLPGTAVPTAVGTVHDDLLPHEFVLEQNYPNPFNPTTLIRYGLPHRSNVELVIYNTLGQKVAELAHGTEEAGYHEVKFDATRFSSGVYFYTLRADEFIETRKLLLVK